MTRRDRGRLRLWGAKASAARLRVRFPASENLRQSAVVAELFRRTPYHSLGGVNAILPSHSRACLLHPPPMNVSLFWDKLSKVILLLLALALIVFAFLHYLPLIRTNQNYRKELLALDARVAEQQRLERQLRASMDSLQNDPKAIERLAREKLGWAKTNEMVIRFEPAVRR